MYQAEIRIPQTQLPSLAYIKDISQHTRFDVTGHCIKDMTCDPYGHLVFATSDVKVGALLVYDVEENQALRRVSVGHHTVDVVSMDAEHNFVSSAETGKELRIYKHNLKGEKVMEIELDRTEVQKIYALASLADCGLVVSVLLANHHSELWIYNKTGQKISSISRDPDSNPYFTKPLHVVSSGDVVVVGDVGSKNIRGFSIEKSSLLWSYKLDTPRGMCVDGDGNICVCDFRNNRVSLLAPDGKLIGHAMTGLSKPQYVTVQNSKMYVLDMGRSTSYRVTVYDLHKSTKRKRKTKPEWQ